MCKVRSFILMTAATLLLSCPVFATSLWFEPGQQFYDYGDTLTYDLYADIDQADAIYGFGFDLSFDGGNTYVSLGDQGTYLTFTGFEANSTYFDTPFWPSPIIAGDVGWNPSVSGKLLLGTLSFDAPTVVTAPLGIETIWLGPAVGDYGTLGTEGLVGDTTALMPNNPTATAAPVPEPATLLLFGTGLAALACRKCKAGRSTV